MKMLVFGGLTLFSVVASADGIPCDLYFVGVPGGYFPIPNRYVLVNAFQDQTHPRSKETFPTLEYDLKRRCGACWLDSY